MQGREVSGRPVSTVKPKNSASAPLRFSRMQIDVHYSLPRGDERQQRCDREKAQVTVMVEAQLYVVLIRD